MMLDSLYNKYLGHRLFVLGTGPSILKVDMTLLFQEYTFGLNAFIERCDPPFMPTFYGVVEDLDRQSKETMLSLGQAVGHPDCTVFLGDEVSRKWPDIIWVPVDNKNDMRDEAHFWGSWCNWEKKAARDATVALDLGVQLGDWMGFNPIYLLGCELTEARRRGQQDVEKSREAMQVVAKMLAQKGVSLINLSEGCTVAMPIQDWREVLIG